MSLTSVPESLEVGDVVTIAPLQLTAARCARAQTEARALGNRPAQSYAPLGSRARSQTQLDPRGHILIRQATLPPWKYRTTKLKTRKCGRASWAS